MWNTACDRCKKVKVKVRTIKYYLWVNADGALPSVWIVLFDIDKIIEFPPGSQSVVMRHGNTPIQPHKKCMGFTQYAAGALFRWVDNGFQTAEDKLRQKFK